jgi:hypothetical protein
MDLQLKLPGDWPVGHIRRTHPEPDADDLESVLYCLQEVEINAWVQTTPPAHIAAGIHDADGGEDVWDVFYARERGVGAFSLPSRVGKPMTVQFPLPGTLPRNISRRDPIASLEEIEWEKVETLYAIELLLDVSPRGRASAAP